MFFDLEAGLAILCNIICRVQPQIFSSFFLFGVLEGGADCASDAVPMCRGAGGASGTWSSLLFCTIVPYESAMTPFTFSLCFPNTWSHKMAILVHCSYLRLVGLGVNCEYILIHGYIYIYMDNLSHLGDHQKLRKPWTWLKQSAGNSFVHCQEYSHCIGDG